MPSNAFSRLVGKLKRKTPGLGHNGEIGETFEHKDDVCNGHEKKNRTSKRVYLWIWSLEHQRLEESTVHLTCSDAKVGSAKLTYLPLVSPK